MIIFLQNYINIDVSLIRDSKSMMSFSGSECQGSDAQRNVGFDDKYDYQNKINAIWQHIQRTKKMDHSDEQSYQMYRNKRIGDQQKIQSAQKYKSQLPRKIADHIKTKKMQQPPIEQKFKSLSQHQSPQCAEYTINIKQRQQTSKYQGLQEKLQKSKENTNILMKKLIQAQEQIQYLEYELQRQITEKEQLMTQVQNKTQRYTSDKQNRHMNSNALEEKEIQSRVLVDKYQLRLRVAEREIEQKDSKLKLLQSQMRKLNTQLHDYKLKNSESSLEKVVFKGSELLQLNQAYKTIERLVALLRSTEQYRLLGNFAQDVKNVHFLSKIPKQIRSQLANVRIASKNKDKHSVCNCTQVRINERLLWTPLLCYKKMLEMKMKHNSLNEECIEEVLFQMNRLYLSKEQSRVHRMKASYEAEIQKLKKKTQLTYDEILAKKQIERLKKELNTSKKKQLKPPSRKPSTSNPNERTQISSTSHLKNLRAIGQYEDQLRVKEKQIKLLTERIKLLENETTSYDKSLYMEGILWIIDKILEELDSNGDDMREFENKFRARIDTASSTEDWIRLFKDFFESIEELNHSLIQKILTIKETTVSKMSHAKDS